MVRIPQVVRFFALAGSLGFLVAAPLMPQVGSAQEAESAPETNDTRFVCQLQNGQHTVMYLPQGQPTQAYPWAVPEDMGSAWPAERRCQEISRRLELYRPDGLLEMQTAMENGYNTVCVTTQQVPTCRIVFTVPSGQDPMATRDRVFENLAIADRGEATQGVNTFVEGGGNILDQLGNVLNLPNSRPSTAINLRPFLDPADGGTGARLVPGATVPAGRPLNPEQFR